MDKLTETDLPDPFDVESLILKPEPLGAIVLARHYSQDSNMVYRKGDEFFIKEGGHIWPISREQVIEAFECQCAGVSTFEHWRWDNEVACRELGIEDESDWALDLIPELTLEQAHAALRQIVNGMQPGKAIEGELRRHDEVPF